LPPGDYDHVNDTSSGVGKGPGLISLSDHLEVLCGPLLNYKSMNTDNDPSRPDWHGSVLIVTKPGQKQPLLNLRPLGPVAPREPGSQISGDLELPDETTVKGVKLYADPNKAFWRFSLDVPMEDYEAQWEYDIPRFHYCIDKQSSSPWRFVVPSSRESFRIMFHSCNGFSIGTDMSHWLGPNLWKDVMRRHDWRRRSDLQRSDTSRRTAAVVGGYYESSEKTRPPFPDQDARRMR
jgi:hypothetical protein